MSCVVNLAGVLSGARSGQIQRFVLALLLSRRLTVNTSWLSFRSRSQLVRLPGWIGPGCLGSGYSWPLMRR